MAIARRLTHPISDPERSPYVGRRMTLERFLRLPEQEPAIEYENGVVSQKMSPKGPHGRLQLRAAMWFELLGQDRPRPPMYAFTETRVTIGGRSFVPDVSVYLADRVPTVEGGHVAEDFFEPPDIAIEIMSPGQTIRRTDERARLYLTLGVRIVLVADPRRLTVRDHRPDLEPVVLRDADVVELGDVLPGFSFAVAELFSALVVRRG